MYNGPLKPGPKPSATMSNALRTVESVGALPLSPKPSRIDASGEARINNTVVALIAATHGRCWMNRLQRYQNVSSLAFLGRCLIGVRKGFTTKLTSVMPTVIARPTKKIISDSLITATSANSTNATSATSAARVVTSTRCLTIASSAGKKVIDATIINKTPITAPIAKPRAKANPITNRPSNEMITVMPAKITARPEVSTASTTASSTLKPSARHSRYRVTMNNA